MDNQYHNVVSGRSPGKRKKRRLKPSSIPSLQVFAPSLRQVFVRERAPDHGIILFQPNIPWHSHFSPWWKIGKEFPDHRIRTSKIQGRERLKFFSVEKTVSRGLSCLFLKSSFQAWYRNPDFQGVEEEREQRQIWKKVKNWLPNRHTVK